jgi:hypothetical protein
MSNPLTWPVHLEVYRVGRWQLEGSLIYKLIDPKYSIYLENELVGDSFVCVFCC